jgi:hypothetical protein
MASAIGRSAVTQRFSMRLRHSPAGDRLQPAAHVSLCVTDNFIGTILCHPLISNSMSLCEPQRADHCTRCRKPFEQSAVRFMVRQRIVFEVIQNTPIYRGEVVPVCEACITTKERADAIREITCKSCGCSMLTASRWQGTTCSSRCAQRVRRGRQRRLRPMRQRPCAVCGELFTAKRSDARLCSVACKQRAYRLRQQAA